MARMRPRIDRTTGLTLAEHVRQRFNPLRMPNKHLGFLVSGLHAEAIRSFLPMPETITVIQGIRALFPAPAERCELARQQPRLIANLYQFCALPDSPEALFQRHDFLRLVDADLLQRFDFPICGDGDDALVMCRAQWFVEWKLPLRPGERARIGKHTRQLASEARLCPKERSEK
jgi:hypothetical protein